MQVPSSWKRRPIALLLRALVAVSAESSHEAKQFFTRDNSRSLVSWEQPFFLGRISLVSWENTGVFLGCTLHKPRISSVGVIAMTGEQIRLLPASSTASFDSAWAFAVGTADKRQRAYQEEQEDKRSKA
jgi:hypothetical protein